MQQHPEHKKIYNEKSVDDLAESIQATKVIAEIIVNTRGIVLSGWRRVLAARLLGHKTIPALIIEIDEKAEVMFIIEQNNTRLKTYSEKANEIQKLIDWYGKRQGYRSDLDSRGEKVNTNQFFAAKMGISDQEVKKLKLIIASAHREEILKLLDKADIDVTFAYKMLLRLEKSDENPDYEGPSDMVDLGVIVGFSDHRNGVHFLPASHRGIAVHYRPGMKVSFFECSECHEMSRLEEFTGEFEAEEVKLDLDADATNHDLFRANSFSIPESELEAVKAEMIAAAQQREKLLSYAANEEERIQAYVQMVLEEEAKQAERNNQRFQEFLSELKANEKE